MEINWNAIGLAVAIALYGGMGVWWMRRHFAAALAQIRALPRLVQAVLAVLAVVATVEAQKRGAVNGDGRPGARTLVRESRRIGDAMELGGTRLLSGGIVPGPGATVTIEEIEQGYRLVSETNEPGYSFAMPTNALHVGNLHLHGARTDFGVRSIDLGTIDGVETGWAFPYGAGDSAYSSFWWFMDGRLQDGLRTPACAISAGLGDALAMQGESRVWMRAEGGTRTITWERFFAGGDTNVPVNAQISLKDTGTFIVRSNDNVRVYRRIDENDWDGDGLDNFIDDSPFVAGEDCHGTGTGWLNANCGAVLSASTDLNGDLEIEWYQSANENAYYWLHFTALRDGTRVTLVCDGSSDLGDLVVIADEGQSCDVPLLMGPSYHVMANWPIADIWASDYEAVFDFGGTRGGMLRSGGGMLRSGSGTGPSSDFTVERPVEIELPEDGTGGSLVTYPDVGAAIGAVTGDCCCASFGGAYYTWQCCGCSCEGYGQSWDVVATWEGYSRLFSWMAQCPCQRAHEEDPEYWIGLSATSVVVTNGTRGSVSASFNPPESAGEATATLRLEQNGDGRIALFGNENGTGSVSLPMTLSAGDEISFWFGGTEVSDSVGDVVFCLDVNDGTDSYTCESPVTVANVKEMWMSCDKAEAGPNPPPFGGNLEWPFSETNSPSADRHLFVPYWNAVETNSMTVSDFTVSMGLTMEPAGVSTSSLDFDWEMADARPQMSGSFVHSGGSCASFVNPKRGGVYRFRARCCGGPWTTGNVVLPLSGASVDGRLAGDIALVDGFIANIHAKYPSRRKYSAKNGFDWFYARGRGDYIGRADNAASPTVWVHNQVNDSNGLGPCCTLAGYPIRNAKLSNFLIAYASQKLGVSADDMETARAWLRTPDDPSAAISWEAGVSATGTEATLSEIVGNMAHDAFLSREEKASKLWPNLPALDNAFEGMPAIYTHQPNVYFYSPSFLFRTPL